MNFSLVGKTAIVTGGGSGIGRAICLALASQGAEVHVLDLKLEAASATVAEITEGGNRAIAYACDVTDLAAVRATVAGIPEIDLLINNAGIAHVGSVEATTAADMDRLYAVNVKGVYHCLHVCVPRMKERGGVILNLASIAASCGLENRFAYSMTKGAVLSMTYSVAKDYLRHNLRCNSISPARIHTPFVDGFLADNYPGREAEMFEQLSRTQPLGRMGLPREVADLAVYLCTDAASFITGTDFPIDGGFLKLNG